MTYPYRFANQSISYQASLYIALQQLPLVLIALQVSDKPLYRYYSIVPSPILLSNRFSNQLSKILSKFSYIAEFPFINLYSDYLSKPSNSD